MRDEGAAEAVGDARTSYPGSSFASSSPSLTLLLEARSLRSGAMAQETPDELATGAVPADGIRAYVGMK